LTTLEKGNALGIEPRKSNYSPEWAKQHAEFIKAIRHLFCPFRARNRPVSGTRGGATLCPGLICFGPCGAEILASVESRWLKLRNIKTIEYLRTPEVFSASDRAFQRMK
jgi:hypothetical protein